MRIEDGRRSHRARILGGVIVVGTAAAGAWLFSPRNDISRGAMGEGSQDGNPVASDQMTRELGRLTVGKLDLSLTSYSEFSVGNDASKMEVVIYGKSKKDPREVTGDGTWSLVIGSRDGQFPATMAVYPPAVKAGATPEGSGFAYDVVIGATIPKGTENFSLEVIHDMGSGASESQSVPIGQADRQTPKKT